MIKDHEKSVIKNIPSSFRDPSGSLFIKDGVIYRKIALAYREHFDWAEKSGLYKSLIKDRLLIPHREVRGELEKDKNTYKIISPEKIPFISYPYEWCFSQLKDAALLTLEIQKKALRFEMILKDASAFNVQFLCGKPVFIDTLSFEKYEEGTSWLGYRQFCQHFLAPLALMSYKDPSFNRLFSVFLDGIPLRLTSSLLPFWTIFRPLLASHIHIHAKSRERFAKRRTLPSWRISRRNLLALLESLKSAVKGLTINQRTSEWEDYYEKTNYSAGSFREKKDIIRNFLKAVNPKTVWDFGANTGEFSRLASRMDIETLSFDKDPLAIEKNYLETVRKKEENLLPLVMDLTNPSPAIGWNNTERSSLQERGPADMIFALALIHHLAISNNLPLKMIAEYFSKACRYLIIEFVPKNDSQVRRLLKTRKDIFPNYNQETFEAEFSRYFFIKNKKKIAESERTLYLMAKNKNE